MDKTKLESAVDWAEWQLTFNNELLISFLSPDKEEIEHIETENEILQTVLEVLQKAQDGRMVELPCKVGTVIGKQDPSTDEYDIVFKGIWGEIHCNEDVDYISLGEVQDLMDGFAKGETK